MMAMASLSSITMISYLLVIILTTKTTLIDAAKTTRKTITNTDLSNLNYLTFPDRKASEAAVVEWGHSAIISAIDATVASFGPQTSRGAFFEVEASPILADPVDGVGEEVLEKINKDENYVYEPKKLKNAEEVHGNMVVMTNTANLSGVTMAKIAQDSGAAALMVVNVDRDYPDYVYSLEPENDEEAKYAEDNIDIPVIMVSLQSGNVLTTATVDENTDPKDIVNNGMPERIRLYGGGDRPFFEDVLNNQPVVYIIHNLLTEEECDELIKAAESKLESIDDNTVNYLEHTVPPLQSQSQEGIVTQNNIQRTTVWRGALNPHSGKQIEERIEQVTGFPQDHFSDFQVNKYVEGSYHGVHYDTHPLNAPMATITVFLNDVDEGDGGELVFPSPALGGLTEGKKKKSKKKEDKDPVKIYPKKGIAVVHHNTDENYEFDTSTLHAELPLKKGVKYVAKKFIDTLPQPPSKRIVLPFLALPFGGKLPGFMITLYQLFLDKFGLEQGNMYFDKFCVMAPVLILFMITSAITNMVKNQLSSSSASSSPKVKSSDKVKKEPSKGKAAGSQATKKKTGSKAKKTQKAD